MRVALAVVLVREPEYSAYPSMVEHKHVGRAVESAIGHVDGLLLWLVRLQLRMQISDELG